MTEKEGYVYVGKVVKPHGYKGDVTIRVEETFYGLPESVEFLYMNMGGDLIPYFIEDFADKNNGHYKINFEEIANEDEAKLIKGKELFIDRETAEEFNPDYDLENQLKGFKVFDAVYDFIGVSSNFGDFNGSQILEVLNDKNEEILIPLHEDFIVKIDTDKKEIHLNLPEGLVELNDDNEDNIERDED